MTTQYIIKFINDINDADSNSINCVLRLTKTDYDISYFEIKSDNQSEEILFKFITNNFAKVNYNDDDNTCNLTFSNNPSITSQILFDKNSASAYTEFKKQFNSLMNTNYEPLYYNNGNIKYIGEVLYIKNDGEITRKTPHGNGIYYYNVRLNTIKYNGDFEQGKFDGSGTFYNYDNKIKIVSKNISNGIPIGDACIQYNYSNYKETVDINFSDVWKMLKITSKDAKRDYVLSDNFVKNISKLFCILHNPKKIKEYRFMDMSQHDKNIVLWNKMNKLKTQINQEGCNFFKCIYLKLIMRLNAFLY